MQWKIYQSKEIEVRDWLHFELDKEGRELFIVLASQEMLRTAKRWGSGQAISAMPPMACSDIAQKKLLNCM
jgi:hypothetical protein